MLRNLKFLTFGLLIVDFVGLSIGGTKSKGSSASCKGSGTEEQYRAWLKGMRSTIAKSKTPVSTDEIYEAWQNDRLELVLNAHNLPSGNLPPRPADSKGMCSPAHSTKSHASSHSHKSSSSGHRSKASSKGSSSSGHSKGSSSSGHSKGSSSSGHSKGSSSSGHSKGSSSSGHSKGSRSGTGRS